jgi:hypothetical protein
MSVEVRTTVKFKPWGTPNFAVLDNTTDGGDRENHTIHVKELDASALDALSWAWLEELYQKVGKDNPYAPVRG